MARFLRSHILLLLVVLLSLVLGVASDEDYPHRHDHDHHRDHDQHHDHDDHNEMDDHNVNSDNNINNAEGNENNVPVDFDARNDIDINANHDRQFLDMDSPEGWEPERRAKILKIAVGVVSILLLASLVLNGVLLYKCCMRKRNLTYTQGQEAFQAPMKTAPPCTPPPPYAAKLPPKVDAWEEKKELPRY